MLARNAGWEPPKALLDACFPEYSAINYSEHVNHANRSRALAYYLSHTLDSSYPGFGLSLLVGMQRAFADRFGQLEEYDYGLYVAPEATKEARVEMIRICGKHIAR